MASRLEFKYRWVWIDDEGNPFGTNNEDVADHASTDFSVIDVHKGCLFGSGEALTEMDEVPPDEDE